MRARGCALSLLIVKFSIRKYFSLIMITIPQEDMCAVLVEIISSFLA